MASRAMGYLRVSGLGQIKGDGFARQQAAILEFAKVGGFEIDSEFRDEGVSGATELTGRSGLAAALNHAEQTGINVVIVERADRLARTPDVKKGSRDVRSNLHRSNQD